MKIVFNFLFLFCAAAVQVYASEPQRVITLLPSLGEVVYEVLENKTALVAVSNYTDFPPELKKVQTIGAYHHVNVEKIVSLKPDFVFVSRDGNNIDQIKQLEDHKIRICYLNLNSLNDIEQSYRIVGEALGQKKKGNQLAQQFREKINELKTQATEGKKIRTAFIQVAQTPLVTLGSGSYMNELLSLVPLKNIFFDQKTDYFKTSREAVIQKKPDFIIVFDMNNDYKKSQQHWEGSVIRVETDEFMRPTARSLLGVQILKSKIKELLKDKTSEK